MPTHTIGMWFQDVSLFASSRVFKFGVAMCLVMAAIIPISTKLTSTVVRARVLAQRWRMCKR